MNVRNSSVVSTRFDAMIQAGQRHVPAFCLHNERRQFRLPTAAIPVTLRVRFVTIQGGADIRYPSRNLKLVRLNGQSITGEPTS